MTLLAELVAASVQVAGTTSRSRKVSILAERLRMLDASEVGISAGFLSGVPRQGRVGIGFSTVYGVERRRARSNRPNRNGPTSAAPSSQRSSDDDGARSTR